jgi:hypothetical protein
MFGVHGVHTAQYSSPEIILTAGVDGPLALG